MVTQVSTYRSRIYDSEDYGDLFEAHSKSREYSPVAAYDPSNQIKERTQQKLADIQMLARGAQRQYELDQMYLKTEGEAGVRQLKFDADKANQGLENFKSLLGLSSLAMKTAQTIKENKDKYDGEVKEIEALGLGLDPNIELTPEQKQHKEEKNLAIKADSAGAAQVATEYKKDGTLDGQAVAHAVQQTTVYQSLKGAENNTYAAIAAYPAFLVEFENATPPDKKPTGPAETKAFLLEANRQFFRQTGMYGASHDDKVRLARSIAGVGQNFLLQSVSRFVKNDREANVQDAKGFVSILVDGFGQPQPDGQPTLTAQEVWNKASDRYLQGNLGYGDNPRGANLAALENLLQEAVDSKNMQLLNDLRNVEKVPGNKGTALGKQYDNVFDKYERQLRQQAVQDNNLDNAEKGVQRQQAIDDYLSNATVPGSRRKAIETLLALGDEESVKLAYSLAEKGFNYDPTKAIDLQRMKDDGQKIDQNQLDQMMTSGVITPEEYKRFSTRGPAADAEKDLDKFLKPLGAGFKAAMQNNAPATALTQELKLQLISRHQLFMDELKQSLMMEIGVNPNLAKDKAALSKLVEAKAAQLMQRPQYRLERDPEKGYQFKGDLNATRTQVKAWRGDHYDYSSLSAEKIFGDKIKVNVGQVNPGRDRFISYETLRSDLKAVLAGKDASNNTRLIAKKFGLSTPAFVNQQLKAYGLPSLSDLRATPDGAALMPGANGDIRNATHAMQLFRAHGFPKKGAAYLAGNLQQEAGLNGRREWYSPMNDGSGRNGGIVSWNRGRLIAIERRYGRNIKQITEMEQLQFMLNEMKTSYSEAYRIFMNPNSTDAQLRRASYLYWGYGEERSRYTYAASLEKYGRI